jgi:hypothetical protein
MDFAIQIPTCIICFETCKIPQIDSCGHTFCKECILAWRKQNSHCPITKKYTSGSISSNDVIDRLFGSQDSVCGHASRGCSWVGNMKHLTKYHWDNCVFKNYNHSLLESLVKNNETKRHVNLMRFELDDGSVFEGLLDETGGFKLGVLTKSSEFVYEGTFENTRMSGYGKFYDIKSGEKYEGQFFNNRLHGYAVLMKQGILAFEGTFEDGLIIGPGIAYNSNHKVRGNFRLDDSRTKGELVKSNDQSFKGTFENFIPSQGTMTYPDGKVVQSSFQKGKANGKATIQYSNGDKYAGSLLDDQYEGEGKLYIASNSMELTANFKQGKKYGPATININGQLYCEANFVENAFDGSITFHGQNGELTTLVFEKGEVKNPIVFLYRDGSKFTTNQKENSKKKDAIVQPKIKFSTYVFHIPIRGTLIYPTNDKFKGEIIAGLREGNGTFTFANGDVFTGKYMKDKAEGEGNIEFKKNKITLEGTWKNDLLDGVVLLKQNNKAVQKQIWQNGELIEASHPGLLPQDTKRESLKPVSSRRVVPR